MESGWVSTAPRTNRRLAGSAANASTVASSVGQTSAAERLSMNMHSAAVGSAVGHTDDVADNGGGMTAGEVGGSMRGMAVGGTGVSVYVG